jgi:hypothetical protein
MSLEQTVKAKLAAKYDHELERKLRTWYGIITLRRLSLLARVKPCASALTNFALSRIGEVVPDNKAACSDESIKLNDLLKDGVILCKCATFFL